MLRDDGVGILQAMRIRGIAVLTAVGLLTLPALAGAASNLTATNIRIGDHPAFVRVVVDFSGGVLRMRDVENEWGDDPKTASVGVRRPNATTRAARRTAYGVSARVVKDSGHLRVDMGLTRKIKYLSYAVVTGNRLAIDLWKSTPPSKSAEIRTGAGGCLALRSWDVTRGTVAVTGSERGIFEHTFQVVVWGAHGNVLGRQTVAKHGQWSARVHYRATHRQLGTLEAVAFSPKDSALSCIAQVRVNLPAS